MVFVHAVFHLELALFWPACCPFHSASPAWLAVPSCSSTNAGVSHLFCIYFICMCPSIFQLLGKHFFSFLAALSFTSSFYINVKYSNLFELAMTLHVLSIK